MLGPTGLIPTQNLFNAALNNCECITFVSFLFCVSDILTFDVSFKNVEKIQNSFKNILWRLIYDI